MHLHSYKHAHCFKEFSHNFFISESQNLVKNAEQLV